MRLSAETLLRFEQDYSCLLAVLPSHSARSSSVFGRRIESHTYRCVRKRRKRSDYIRVTSPCASTSETTLDAIFSRRYGAQPKSASTTLPDANRVYRPERESAPGQDVASILTRRELTFRDEDSLVRNHGSAAQLRARSGKPVANSG
jgi:hypothetical protein